MKLGETLNFTKNITNSIKEEEEGSINSNRILFIKTKARCSKHHMLHMLILLRIEDKIFHNVIIYKEYQHHITFPLLGLTHKEI